uniref:Uncharacterized protein n=1 Tax=Trichuris muris TaxID=70415 RepID=A0A5S6QP48_TRIMR
MAERSPEAHRAASSPPEVGANSSFRAKSWEEEIFSVRWSEPFDNEPPRMRRARKEGGTKDATGYPVTLAAGGLLLADSQRRAGKAATINFAHPIANASQPVGSLPKSSCSVGGEWSPARFPNTKSRSPAEGEYSCIDIRLLDVGVRVCEAQFFRSDPSRNVQC